MQVGLIAQFMEPTPSLTAVVMACVTTQNRLFTSALTRAGLCSATRHVLTSRDPKAKQSKPTALLTGRKEAPTDEQQPCQLGGSGVKLQMFCLQGNTQRLSAFAVS